MFITSQNNPTVRLAASLSAKKQRETTGLYIVEGPNIIREALAQGCALQTLFFSDEMAADARVLELAEIRRMAAESAAPPDIVTLGRDAFKRIAQTETSQGVAGIAKKRYSTEQDVFRCAGANALVLDRIQDPGNLGTLLRTAEAAGFSGALLMKGCGDAYGPKAVRAASGTLFRLPLLQVDTAQEAIRLLRSHGKRIYAADAGAPVDYYDCDIARDAAIVIGNEGNGISKEWARCADVRLSIPMAGQAESLNAALAGGIIMYEAYRQKRTDMK